MTHVWVVAGVICVDEICATAVVVKTDYTPRFCSGYVHGVTVGEAGAVYVEEAVVLHALRVLKEWMLPVDQTLLQHVNILAGGALVHYQIKEWLTKGRCTLRSAAASGLVRDIQGLGEWLHTETSLRPFYLPEDPADEDVYISQHQEMFLGIAEYFRTVVIPSQGQGWKERLPGVPMVTEELRTLIKAQHERDERAALSRLAALGSASAEILMGQLGITRTILREALNLLRDERKAQVNLLEILSATRFRVITSKGL